MAVISFTAWYHAFVMFKHFHWSYLIFVAIFPELSRFWWKLCKFVSAHTYDDMDWLFTNLGAVIDERKTRTYATKSSESDKYSEAKSSRPMDLLQILLDAEVGSGSSRGNAVSHLTMQESEEDVNSNYEVDSTFSPEITNKSTVTYLKSKLDQVFHQQQAVEDIGLQTPEGKWPCPSGAPCEAPKSKLSLDVSKSRMYQRVKRLLLLPTYLTKSFLLNSLNTSFFRS